MTTRKDFAPKRDGNVDRNRDVPGLTIPLLATSFLVLLVATLQWPRRWLFSGCAVETLLVLYGFGNGARIFPSTHLWTLLATFNLIYSICSTSWLLYGFFAAACWPFVLLTCLFQFSFAANLVRRSLRKSLRQLHFTRDKIALFNLPALEIDTDVDGLLVIRGLTISLSSLTVVAHGIEIGMICPSFFWFRTTNAYMQASSSRMTSSLQSTLMRSPYHSSVAFRLAKRTAISKVVKSR